TARLVMKPFPIGEWLMPPGSRVVTGIAPLHKDGRFHADARRFDPDRYVGKKPDTYAWIPFGGGMRRCLGAAFPPFPIDTPHAPPAPGQAGIFRGGALAPSGGGATVVRRRSLGSCRPMGDKSSEAVATAQA